MGQNQAPCDSSVRPETVWLQQKQVFPANGVTAKPSGWTSRAPGTKEVRRPHMIQAGLSSSRLSQGDANLNLSIWQQKDLQ